MFTSHQCLFMVQRPERSSPTREVEAMQEMEQLRWGRCLVLPAQLQVPIISKGWNRQVTSSKSIKSPYCSREWPSKYIRSKRTPVTTCSSSLSFLLFPPSFPSLLFSLSSSSFLLQATKIYVPWMVFLSWFLHVAILVILCAGSLKKAQKLAFSQLMQCAGKVQVCYCLCVLDLNKLTKYHF